MALIKWAGGKSQLLNELKKDIPGDIGTYVEPFIGSGALFFDIKPQKAIIGDINRELINLYKMVQSNWIDLENRLKEIEEEYNSLSFDLKKTYYYEKRETFNKNIISNELTCDDAALFIFLNKTCFNGLYRVNKKGYYNVPFGKRKNVCLVDKEGLGYYSDVLKSTTIKLDDFEKVCNGLKAKDLVYFDSPYYDTFDTYQPGGFPESEHIRLFKLFDELSDKGVYCMLSNSDTSFIKELYRNYNIETVEVKRMINRNGNDRIGTEVIIRNY